MALAHADIATLSRLLDEALALDVVDQEAWIAALPAEHERHAQRLREMLAAQAGLVSRVSEFSPVVVVQISPPG